MTQVTSNVQSAWDINLPLTYSGGIVLGIRAADVKGVGEKVYLDYAPDTTEAPYVTHNEMPTMASSLSGDNKTLYVDRTQQFDLWQKANDEDTEVLIGLLAALDGMKVTVDGSPFTAVVKLASCSRINEPEDTGLIHHEITVSYTHPIGMI